MSQFPWETPDVPMTEEQIRMVITNEVAVQALIMLSRRPSWNEWQATMKLTEHFLRRH